MRNLQLTILSGGARQGGVPASALGSRTVPPLTTSSESVEGGSAVTAARVRWVGSAARAGASHSDTASEAGSVESLCSAP
jgi:hypothetical protein